MAQTINAFDLGCLTADARIKQADFISGGVIGAGLGGLYGAFNPKVTYEIDPTAKKKNQVIPRKHYFSSILNNALGYGILGAGIGSIVDPSRKARGNTPNDSSSNDTASSRDLSKSKPFEGLLPPEEWRGDLKLKPYLEDAYGKAPGGLDAAIATAEQYKAPAMAAGLHTYKNEAELSKPVTVSNKVSDWTRFVDSFKRNNGRTTMGSGTDFNRVGGVTLDRKTPSGEPRIIMNPVSSEISLFKDPLGYLKMLRHELTHATYDNRSENPVFSRKDVGSSVSGRLAPYVDYVGHPAELAAHLAEAKREYVKSTGKQVKTPEDAMKVLEHFENDPKNKKDVLSNLLPALMTSPDITQKMLLQILSIVKGKPSTKSDAAYA